MPRVIDADSHFMEPLDLWELYIEPEYRDRCLRFKKDPETDKHVMWVNEDKRIAGVGEFSMEELLGVGVGYGQKEDGSGLGSFDFSSAFNNTLEDMENRISYLDREGFESQFIYPTLGLMWEGQISDPALAAAHCRAYNTWALEIVSAHRERLFPVGHISLRDPYEAVREIERLAGDGARTIFVGALPVGGKSFGSPEFDPIWDAAHHHDIAVALHLVVHRDYIGHDWYSDRRPGFMFLSMNGIQDPRMALTTMVYDGVFERFPRLRVATVESGSGWVVEWLDRLDYRYSYMGASCQMERPASEYFERNIWVAADPDERMLPYMVEILGDHKFFIGSDYPHAEGFTDPVAKARMHLKKLPRTSIDKILGGNAVQFFAI